MINFKSPLLYLFLGCSILVSSQSQKNDKGNLKANKSLHKNYISSKGYPVDPFNNDTLFFVYNRIGVFSAENRAQAITNRIESLYKDPSFKKDSLRLIKTDIGVEIVYKSDFVVMTVTDSDGKRIGRNNFELAQKNLAIIQKKVLFHKENDLGKNWIKRIGIMLLFAIGVIVIFIAFKERYKKL